MSYDKTVVTDGYGELLRPLALWAADVAERSLPLFEASAPADRRPRDAIDAAREFGHGGRRTAQLRALGWAAHAASRDVDDPAAQSAARAASLAASAAYTHLDVASVHQVRHVLGPAVYAAQARELACGGDRRVGDAEIAWAVEHALAAVRELVGRAALVQRGRGRFGELSAALHVGLLDPPE